MSVFFNREEFRKAYIVLLKLVQCNSFRDSPEIKLNSLKTVTDSNGLLRVKAKIFMREKTQ